MSAWGHSNEDVSPLLELKEQTIGVVGSFRNLGAESV